MKKKQSVLCIIPIRSGSKTLKNKNIKEFKGKPLSFHNIKTAEASNIFLKIVVATDSHKYIRILRLHKAKQYIDDYLYDTISQISYAVGYYDTHYFSKLFRQQYNMSPKELLNARRL